jgi:hypothetical protein
MTYLLSNARNKAMTLLMLHEFNQTNITQIE